MSHSASNTLHNLFLNTLLILNKEQKSIDSEKILQENAVLNELLEIGFDEILRVQQLIRRHVRIRPILDLVEQSAVRRARGLK